jgi:hypothetical protein
MLFLCRIIDAQLFLQPQGVHQETKMWLTITNGIIHWGITLCLLYYMLGAQLFLRPQISVVILSMGNTLFGLSAYLTSSDWLTDSFTHSLARSLAVSLSQSLAHLLSHSLTLPLTHSLALSISRSLAFSLSHSLTRSLSHSLNLSLTCSLTLSLSH